MELRLKGSVWISARKQGKAILTDIVPLNQLTQKIGHVHLRKADFFHQDGKNLETKMSSGWVCAVKSNDQEGVHEKVCYTKIET